MKALFVAAIMGFAMSATAATTCIVTESTDGGETYEKVLNTVQVAADGNPALVFQRDTEAFLAVDNGSMMAIGQLVSSDSGEAKLSIMAASNGTQVMLLNAPSNLAIACVRQ